MGGNGALLWVLWKRRDQVSSEFHTLLLQGLAALFHRPYVRDGRWPRLQANTIQEIDGLEMALRHLTAFIRHTDFPPYLALTSVLLPWMAIVPLFFLTPASEPEGDNRCTHWQECHEQIEGTVTLSSPDQEADEDGPSSE